MLENAQEMLIKNVNGNHTNSHSHGHSHGHKSDVALVGWMIIVGDAFHNFADGLGACGISSFNSKIWPIDKVYLDFAENGLS